MEFIDGIIENIVFRNDDNGYSVMEIDVSGKLETAVGSVPPLGEGERVKLGGMWTNHVSYGSQFKVETCQKLPPDSEDGLLRYLSSGIIKGVGPATAKKIVNAFGDDTLDIIRYNPVRLNEVEGIGKSKAKIIGKALSDHIHMQDNMIFLQSLSVPLSFAAKICNKYGIGASGYVQTYPYQLASDIEGIGFLKADKIARQLGFDANSKERLVAGISYALNDAAKKDGHTCLPLNVLKDRSLSLLQCNNTLIDEAIDIALKNRDVVLRNYNDVEYVYLPYYDMAEKQIALRLSQLTSKELPDVGLDIDEAFSMLKTMKNIELSSQQLDAVNTSLSSGVTIVTGGPGTGKTTIINCIIWALEQINLKVILTAPTGRASKRMSEATDRDASTIHRLLEYGYSENDTNLSFNKDSENQLECDALIVDEMSMVDVSLMHHLLNAIPNDCRLIMVGDADQLPSVGAGNLLRDIIDSGFIKVEKLTQIFRQAQQSLIVMNAHKINNGEKPELFDRKSDFFFVKENNIDGVINSLISMATTRIPKYINCNPLKDIQILSPVKKSELGIINLNQKLQEVFNPPDDNKQEKTFGSFTYRVGDKVMQIKNNYNIKWRKRLPNGAYFNGEGIFNGDTGYISLINNTEKSITVDFDDDKQVEYTFSNLEELSLAYAVTIHKSQGSEYDVIILPLFSGTPMLFTRNLLYTAVTRAKKMVVIIGNENIIFKMIDNDLTYKRYSGLKYILQG